MKYKLLMLSALIACSCSNSVTEANNKPPTNNKRPAQDVYQDSDEALNSAFKELTSTAPVLLNKKLKKEQSSWLKERGETCSNSSLGHPKQAKSLSCITDKNKQQVKVLKQRTMILQDLLDRQFTVLSKDSSNKYIVDFQANCMCGNIIPYIDSHSNRLITYSSCSSSDDKPLSSEKITDIKFDDLGKLEVVAVNENGTEYKILFDPKGNHVYSIILFGEWGVIKDKDIAGAIGAEHDYTSETYSLCSDFDG